MGLILPFDFESMAAPDKLFPLTSISSSDDESESWTVSMLISL